MPEPRIGEPGSDLIRNSDSGPSGDDRADWPVETTSDAARRRDLADTVIAEVTRHAVAEEMYVYPAIEEHLPNGAEEVEHDKQEHDEIVQVMKQMENVEALRSQVHGSGPAA